MTAWRIDSWQRKASLQQVTYPSEMVLNEVLEELSILPPLVTTFEIDNLKKQLALAAQGKAFLLQGGDCAESFDLCRPLAITNKLKILLQMSLVLLHGLRKPVIRVGRIAGQYAKPRSEDLETIDGVTLPSYRGDLINGQAFTSESRIPDPRRLKQGYEYSALTLNYIRALINGGFANLQHPENWDLDFVKHSPLEKQYKALVGSIEDALNFVQAFSNIDDQSLNRVDFFTSHEALQLYYEQALTRQREDGKFYDLSCHFPWIGMRTANLEGGHIEFLKGINNPIAVKVGPNMDAKWLVQLIETLNPHNEAGRLTLIVRLGAKQVRDKLPTLIETVKQTGHTVLWSCDPMHGNTEKTPSGIKTRRFDDILNELIASFEIHQAMGTYLGGVHFELTGEDVTECMGGARGLTEADLKRAYHSLVDPRLNYEQALEMALLIAGHSRIEE